MKRIDFLEASERRQVNPSASSAYSHLQVEGFPPFSSILFLVIQVWPSAGLFLRELVQLKQLEPPIQQVSDMSRLNPLRDSCLDAIAAKAPSTPSSSLLSAPRSSADMIRSRPRSARIKRSHGITRCHIIPHQRNVTPATRLCSQGT